MTMASLDKDGRLATRMNQRWSVFCTDIKRIYFCGGNPEYIVLGVETFLVVTGAA